MKKPNYQELKDTVYNYKTKHSSGFTREEQLRLCDELSISKPKYLAKLGINTGLMIGDECITYHCDVLNGLNCAINDVDLKYWEWD